MSGEQRGIFNKFDSSDSEDDEKQDETTEKHLERMHDIFYPQHWKEACLNVEKLWLINECKNRQDLDKADSLFDQNCRYFDDAEARQKIGQHVLKVGEENQFNTYDEVKQAFLQSIMFGKEVIMIDMPTVMLRMKVVETHSLQELTDMFNFILDKMQRGEGPEQSAAAAHYFYPEMFNKPRDLYMTSLLHEICS